MATIRTLHFVSSKYFEVSFSVVIVCRSFIYYLSLKLWKFHYCQIYLDAPKYTNSSRRQHRRSFARHCGRSQVYNVLIWFVDFVHGTVSSSTSKFVFGLFDFSLFFLSLTHLVAFRFFRWFARGAQSTRRMFWTAVRVWFYVCRHASVTFSYCLSIAIVVKSWHKHAMHPIVCINWIGIVMIFECNIVYDFLSLACKNRVILHRSRRSTVHWRHLQTWVWLRPC